jgi:hypothetical protein
MPMIWQAMILASIWFATKTCQTLLFSLLKSMTMFLPNFWPVKSLAWQFLDVNQTGYAWPLVPIHAGSWIN